MLRWIVRAVLLAYLIMPLAAVGLVVHAVNGIVQQVAPVYDAATESIATAAQSLQSEIDGLQASFRPLADTVNALRSGLNIITGFMSDTINGVITFVNGFPGISLPRFDGINMPPLVNLDFIGSIASDVNTIAQQTTVLVDTVTTTIQSFLTAIVTALLLLVIWIVLSVVLFFVQLYRGLWPA